MMNYLWELNNQGALVGFHLKTKEDQYTDGFWKNKRPNEGLMIKEKKYKDYDCPEIILFIQRKCELLIAKPWHIGVIVKMLGTEQDTRSQGIDFN